MNTSQSSSLPPPVVLPDAELSHIAAEAAYDHSIKVKYGECGGGSFAICETKELTFDPEECSPREKAKFLAAHEGAHIAHTASLSELGLSPEHIRRLGQMIGFFPLRNVIEDGAINDANVRRFSRLTEGTLLAYDRPGPDDSIGFINLPGVKEAAELLGHPPLYAQALAGLQVDWSELRHEHGFPPKKDLLLTLDRLGPKVDDPLLKKFFKETVMLSRSCMGIIPHDDEADFATRMKYSGVRFQMMERDIYPHLAELVEKDIQQLASKLRQESKSSSEARRRAEQILAGIDKQIGELIGGLFEKAGGGTPAIEELTTARHQAERDAEEAELRERAAQSEVFSAVENLTASLSPFQQDYALVAPLIDGAYARLVDVLLPSSHYTWRMGLPSGTHCNPLEAMRFEATGEHFNKLWMKRNNPTRSNLLTGLVFDRSISMKQEEVFVPARRALIFFRELYERLKLPTLCSWFATGVGRIVEIDDSMSDPNVQERIMLRTLPRKEGTDDAKGLRYMRKRMDEMPSSKKVIIILSDAGSADGRQLKRAIRALSEEGISVLHFGLGKGTEDTMGLYEYSWGGLDLFEPGPTGFMAIFCDVISQLASASLDPSPRFRPRDDDTKNGV